LKIVEAAAYKLPIICSDVKPYNFHWDNEGVLLTQNSFIDWYNALNNIHEYTLRGQLNYLYCDEHHNLKTINEQRFNMLVELCK
jgi:hypothetical protein